VGTVVQTGWICPTSCTLQVTDGGGAVTVSIPAGRVFLSVDAVLAFLKAEIEATLLSTWTMQVFLGHVAIEMDAYPFSWAWQTATDLRDYLGYAGDVVGQAAPWIAPSSPEGYLSLDLESQDYILAHGGDHEALTLQTVLGNGTSEQAGAASAPARRGAWILDLDNTAGNFAELADVEDWLDLVEDGRPFTVWPLGSSGVSFAAILAPEHTQTVFAPTYPRQTSYWRTTLGLRVQEVSGE
jgi:hypothetical protein